MIAIEILRSSPALLVLGCLVGVGLGGDVKMDPISVPSVADRPRDTDETIVFLYPGADADAFAKHFGLTVVGTLVSDPSGYLMRASSVDAAREGVCRIAEDSRARAAFLNQRVNFVLAGFLPDDAYFHRDTPSPGFPGQWHLVNEQTPALDARVQGAWNCNIVGAGVTVGIVDNCFETAHPDLAPNYRPADSYNFGRYFDSNQPEGPDPIYGEWWFYVDRHGVSVAGVAGARGGNGIGVTGASPYAPMGGLRVDFPHQTAVMFADATMFHSSGDNTAIKVKNHSYGVDLPYVSNPGPSYALGQSTAAGTIHCFAAGNGRQFTPSDPYQDSGKMNPQNTPEAITVAGLGSDGKFAWYSSFGADVSVTAPGGVPDRITTTDRTGAQGYEPLNGDEDYTHKFSGTSASSPLVAGVMAMGKQVQPNLDTRFAKHLLAGTSDIVDPYDSTPESDGNWHTNGGGYHFNQNYGFGLVNAGAFTQAAMRYQGTTALGTETTGTVAVDANIPDGNSGGMTRTFWVSSTTALEEIQVYLDVTHPHRGDLEAYLTSPMGTTGRLMYRSPNDNDANNGTLQWTFLSNAFWGENPDGNWTLMVRDVFAQDLGRWNSFAVTARMGELIPGPRWNADADGNWSAVGSWTDSDGNAPNGRDKVVVMGPTTGARTVNLPQGVSLSTLTFDSNYGYTLSGQALTFDCADRFDPNFTRAALNVCRADANATNTILSAVFLNVPLTITQGDASRISLSGGVGGVGGLLICGGTVVLDGNNSYAGETTICLGVLQVSDANRIPGAIAIDGGGRLHVAAAEGSTITFTQTLKPMGMSGYTTQSGAIVVDANVTVVWSGPVDASERPQSIIGKEGVGTLKLEFPAPADPNEAGRWGVRVSGGMTEIRQMPVSASPGNGACVFDGGDLIVHRDQNAGGWADDPNYAYGFCGFSVTAGKSSTVQIESNALFQTCGSPPASGNVVGGTLTIQGADDTATFRIKSGIAGAGQTGAGTIDLRGGRLSFADGNAPALPASTGFTLKLNGGLFKGVDSNMHDLSGNLVFNDANTNGLARFTGGWTIKADGNTCWAGTGEKLGDGTVNLNRTGGTVRVDPNALMKVSAGFVNAGGTADPFTDSGDPNRHLPVVNNACFSINAGTKCVADISGTGATGVAPNATLKVALGGSLVQSALTTSSYTTVEVAGSVKVDSNLTV